MRIKTVYVRFFKSFNYDYLRKSDPRSEPEPWDVVDDADPRFFPFIKVPLETDITTIVGANESGKSQIISAVKSLLTGQKIQRRDFCRYSTLLTVDREMAVPEFGGEFNELTNPERQYLRTLTGSSKEATVDSFWLFRLNKRVVIYLLNKNDSGKSEWIEKKITDSQLKRIELPSYFEIEADVPLPNSISLEYLTAKKENKKAIVRESTVSFFRTLMGGNEFATEEALTSAAPKLVQRYVQSRAEGADKHLDARLELAEKLLFQVAKIDITAFEELRDAVQSGSGAEGWANGLVRKINAQLTDALNFTKWWTQDAEFSAYLTLRDFDLIFTVQDRTGQEYSFSERSSGMSYFLSYFVQYLSHKSPGHQEILLMDEPDTFLSMQGQQDLLRIFGDFVAPEDPSKKGVQVLYVTHSPFLIDKNHGERIRVLEKGDGDEGTRVVENAARNHYEPLRSAFGAFVAETTFIGNCNLMLEGQADQVLLAGISSLARRQASRQITLDLNSLTLVPAGGAEHIPYLVYVARGRDVDKPAVIVLLDSDDEGDRQVIELRKGYRDRKLLDEEFIIQVGDLEPDQLETSVDSIQEIEDLIPEQVLRSAVKRFAAEVLSPEDSEAFAAKYNEIRPSKDEKLFKAAEKAAVSASPNKERPLSLDKVGIARGVLAALEKDCSPELVQQTLNNFYVLFRHLDKAQQKAMRKKGSDTLRRNLKDLRTRFYRDNKSGVARRDADIFLDDLAAQHLGSDLSSEAARDKIRAVRDRHKLIIDPNTPVADFAELKADIDEIVNRPLLDSQSV